MDLYVECPYCVNDDYYAFSHCDHCKGLLFIPARIKPLTWDVHEHSACGWAGKFAYMVVLRDDKWFCSKWFGDRPFDTREDGQSACEAHYIDMITNAFEMA